VLPLCRALILLYRYSFQQISQLLMNALSLIGRGLKGRPYDQGGRHDIMAGSGEDRCLPLALLDLIIYSARPCPCDLSIEVLWDRASVVVAFIGLISFMGPGSL
jgi:hypothetical protein